MDKNQMSAVLQDVRKAYRLLADYQQRIIELLDFTKDKLGAEHYYHDLPNNYSPQSIHKIYTDENVGKRFLPMLDMHLLWHKTKSIPEGEEWQNHLQKDDLVFDIIVKSNETETSSALHLYVYQCVKYTRKNNWYRDVWYNSDYPNFGEVGIYKDNSDLIEYCIYGERIDLADLFNEQEANKIIEAFKSRTSHALGCKI
jgi:hypothetical protein|nr:hypothetical protein [Moraxella sp.]